MKTILLTFTLQAFNLTFLVNNTPMAGYSKENDHYIVEMDRNQAISLGYTPEDWNEKEEIKPIYIDNR